MQWWKPPRWKQSFPWFWVRFGLNAPEKILSLVLWVLSEHLVGYVKQHYLQQLAWITVSSFLVIKFLLQVRLHMFKWDHICHLVFWKNCLEAEMCAVAVGLTALKIECSKSWEHLEGHHCSDELSTLTSHQKVTDDDYLIFLKHGRLWGLD